jgi:hypothetical protein
MSQKPMNAKVAAQIKGMGVNLGRKLSADEERPKVNPKVASILEKVGVRYGAADIESPINEVSPLNMPGEEPAVQPPPRSGQGTAPNPTVNPAQPKPGLAPKPAAPAPKVMLRKDEMQKMETIQDLQDSMNGLMSSLKTFDQIVQSLSDDTDNDKTIQANKDVLKSALRPLFKRVDGLRAVLEV